MKIDLSLLPQVMNRKYYPLLYNTDRELVVWGSAGSGKSHFCAQKVIIRVVTEPVKHRILVVRRFAPSLLRSAWRLILDYIYEWGLQSYFKVHKKEMILTFKPNGNEIMFAGIDDESKIKSIEKITSIWVEEANQLQYKHILQLKLRLRPRFNSYPQFMTSYNPIKTAWTYKYDYIDDKHLTYRKKVINKIKYKGEIIDYPSYKTVVHTTYKDNKYLPAEYIASLENMANLDRSHYLIYAKGLYADIENLVFPNIHKVEEFPRIKYDFEGYGLDFGYNHPTAICWVGVIGDNIYAKSIYYETGKTPDDVMKFIESSEIGKDDLIIADDERPDAIEQIKRAGYYIKPANKRKNSVLEGINLLKSHKIHILSNDEDFQYEQERYKWKENKAGEPTEEPVKLFDDLFCALRYFVYTNMLGSMKKIKVYST
jgi:phage terminase large subunit